MVTCAAGPSAVMIESRTRGHRTEAWGYVGEELINIFGFATKIGITRPDIRETVYRVSLTLFADIKGNAR